MLQRDLLTPATRGNARAFRRLAGLTAILAVGILTFRPPLAIAQTPATVNLGTAGSFAVLAGEGVTNTGPTVVNGDLGTHPNPAVTGFPPGTVNGTIHAGDAVAAQAKSDLVIAYDDAAGRPCGTDLTGQDLGGMTLTPGVYCFSSSAQLTGTLTLDAQGNPDAVFIFQIGSTLTTAPGSSVSLLGGAQSCNVFWQVGSSATLDTGSTFVGTIMALTSIELAANVTLDGRALARNASVTLIDDDITVATCAQPSPSPSPSPTGGGGGGGGDDDDDDDDDGGGGPGPGGGGGGGPGPGGGDGGGGGGGGPGGGPPGVVPPPIGPPSTGGGSTTGIEQVGLLVMGALLLAAPLGTLAMRRRYAHRGPSR